jgi:hypothetical protein
VAELRRKENRNLKEDGARKQCAGYFPCDSSHIAIGGRINHGNRRNRICAPISKPGATSSNPAFAGLA